MSQSGSCSHGGGGAGAGYELEVVCDCEMQAEPPQLSYDRTIWALIATVDRCASVESSAWYKNMLKDVQVSLHHLMKVVNSKQEQLKDKDKALHELEAKLKIETQCTYVLVFLCLGLLIFTVVMVLKCGHEV